MKNEVGRVDRLADVVLSAVEAGDQPRRARSSRPRRRRARRGSRPPAAGRPSRRACCARPRHGRRAGAPRAPSTMSRGVTCGIVSIPQARWIAIDAMSAFIRARALGLSFTSTKPPARLPERPARPPRASLLLAPFGGSSSTQTTHSLLAQHPRQRASPRRAAAAASAELALADHERCGAAPAPRRAPS